MLKPLKRVLKKLRRRTPSAKVIWAQLAQSNCKAVMLDTPHGFFWTKPGDSAIGFSLFANGEFDYADFSRLQAAISSGTLKLPQDAIFLDVGANIGTHTIYAMNSGLFAQAVCFEPDPENFRFLSLNIKENGYGEKCHLLNMALGGAAGTAELELAADNFGDHRIRQSGQGTGVENRYDEEKRKTVSVRMETLDSALAELGIDPAKCFLHMDVQGFEPYVLQGAPKFLASCKTIFTEFWPYGMARTGGIESFRAQAEAQFTHFIDFGAGETNAHAISGLGDLFKTYAEGIGTTLLLTKK
ncbi:MAG: FkbM family methyltransferase [Parvibaculum sp.]|nr:FkbM family methyltransferase [Parvibaculum sp.]